MRTFPVTFVASATCRASSLVVMVVLSLAPVGSAHVFTVQIVLPSTDPVLIATDRSQAFQAVAYDDQQQDITSEVTWSWDFGDGSAADPDNPTEHVFADAGDYIVTVTATWSAQQAQDQVGVDAQEPDGAFVLAREVGPDSYRSLQGNEVCHTRYLIAFDAVPQFYDGVWFRWKYA